MQQQIVECCPLQAKSGEFALQLQGGRTWRGQQLINVGAVALLAGDSASGGVGLGEQATLLQGPHG